MNNILHPDLVEFRDFAFESWRHKYGHKPTWGGVDFVTLTKAFRRLEKFGDAKARWKIFLLDNSDFFRGHNPRKFLLELDRFIPKSSVDLSTLNLHHIYSEKEYSEFSMKIERMFAGEPEEISCRLGGCVVRGDNGILRKIK